MHLVKHISSFALLLFSVAAFSEPTVVAVVGAKTVTLDEFNKRYDEVKKASINPPSRKVFLEDLVKYEMGVQEATKRNLEKDPLIAERMRQELYKGLIEKDLGERVNAINVNDDEMKDYYKNAPELRTKHILIEIKQGATAPERAAAKKRAEEIYAEVKKSKRPFEELVTLYTDDISTKKNGGDVGFQTKLTVMPTYFDAAMKLKKDEVSGVVETPYGYHIIKLVERHSFADANKRALRAAVFEKKRLSLFNDYFEKLKKHYKVTLNTEAIK